MFCCFTVSVLAIAVLLPAVHTTFLDPDPLQVVVEVLENFCSQPDTAPSQTSARDTPVGQFF